MIYRGEIGDERMKTVMIKRDTDLSNATLSTNEKLVRKLLRNFEGQNGLILKKL